jgi:hypothetical protein
MQGWLADGDGRGNSDLGCDDGGRVGETDTPADDDVDGLGDRRCLV